MKLTEEIKIAEEIIDILAKYKCTPLESIIINNAVQQAILENGKKTIKNN